MGEYNRIHLYGSFSFSLKISMQINLYYGDVDVKISKQIIGRRAMSIESI